MRRENLFGALFFLLTVLLRGYYIWLPIDYSMHEGLDAMAAWKTIEGEIIYRDYFNAQAPLWIYLIAFIYALFGVGLTQGRIIVALCSGMLAVVIFFSGMKKINMKTGIIGGLIFALHPLAIRYGTLMLNDFPAVTFALIGYYYLINGVDESTNQANIETGTEKAYWSANKNKLLAGICLGVGTSIKLTVAPFLVAFVLILLIEGYIEGIDLKMQVTNIGFLVIGFVITSGIVFAYFLLTVRDALIFQTIGQHLADAPIPWLYRFARPLERLWDVDKLLVLILLPSIPFALRTRYGRGLIIIMATLIIWMLLIVSFPHLNYYDMNLPVIAMMCGFFPLSSSGLINFKTKFWRDRAITLQVLGMFLIISYIIYLIFLCPAQIRPITERDQAIKTVEWLKANTNPDEYVLCDNLNINIMALRRGPFAEISIDLMNLGGMTSDMLIQSLYDYNIRVVVVTRRQFGRYDVYDDFMGFLEENYTEIIAGYSIYVRDLPLG